MADTFDWLASQKVVTDAEIEYELVEIEMPNGEHPVFIGRVADRNNSHLAAASLKLSLANEAARERGETAEKADGDLLAAYYLAEREMFAQYVFTGWKNVVNSEGKPSKFTPENCHAFLKMLDQDVFDKLVAKFSNKKNFTPNALSAQEVVDAGNA